MLISAITEKDFAKLTPYVDELGKLGDISRFIDVVGLVKDFSSWNSPENIKQKISIFVQQDQKASYMYAVYVNSDMSFKEMFSGFTGTVIAPEDKALSVIYY